MLINIYIAHEYKMHNYNYTHGNAQLHTEMHNYTHGNV